MMMMAVMWVSIKDKVLKKIGASSLGVLDCQDCIYFAVGTYRMLYKKENMIRVVYLKKEFSRRG